MRGDEVSGQSMGDGDQTDMGEHREEYTNGLGMSPIDRRAGGHGGDASTGGSEMAGGGGEGGDGNGIWRLLASVLAAVLLTGAGSWLMFDRDQITRDEAERMIQKSMPRDTGYAEDRKAIWDKLEDFKTRVEVLGRDASATRDQISALNGKLDVLLAQTAPGRRP
jgi:hypothetical protein